jgi:hypothetical protein
MKTGFYSSILKHQEKIHHSRLSKKRVSQGQPKKIIKFRIGKCLSPYTLKKIKGSSKTLSRRITYLKNRLLSQLKKKKFYSTKMDQE